VALRRKTNDLIVNVNDWVYDRKGKRFRIVRINGAIVHCVSADKWKYHTAGDLDQWGLYSDKPFNGHRASEGALRKQREQSARREAVEKLRDYWENRND
jgi:hypothetical protein